MDFKHWTNERKMKMKKTLFALLLVTSIPQAQSSIPRDTIGVCEANSKKYHCIVAVHFNSNKDEVSGHYSCYIDKSRNTYAAGEISRKNSLFKDVHIKTGRA